MTTYLRDSEGKFIPSTQRPDGTWRKARRVKDGYVPQEEVPLYESKGKKFTKKPDLPVGMCPIMAEEARAKREKLLRQQQQQQRQHIPGVIVLNNKSVKATSSQNKQPKISTKIQNKEGPSGSSDNSVGRLCDGIANVQIDPSDDLQKQLKKMRKKIREIDAIEEKIKNGQLKKPEQDQLDKLSRKTEIQLSIQQLEEKLKAIESI